MGKKHKKFNFSILKIMNKDLVSLSQAKINKALHGIDKSEQIQSLINPDIYFKRNSINLLISRRGVGKTFTVMTELIKLSHLPENGKYSQFVYITDKTNDATVLELIKLIKLKTRVVKYPEALDVLKDLMGAKTAYEQVISKKLQKELTQESKNDLLNSLDLTHFTDYVPHTAVLMDDAINILKDTKYKKLTNLIFQNRQPRLTFFFCCQDSFGIPPSIKRNLDTAWLFAGFTDRTMFGTMIRQLGSPIPVDKLWNIYVKLGEHDALILDYEEGQIVLRVVIDGRKIDPLEWYEINY
jgi:hypothetical protein